MTCFNASNTHAANAYTAKKETLARSLRVYTVTDRSWLGVSASASEQEKQAALCEQVRAALRGGATFIQMREKHVDAANMIAEAAALQNVCRKAGVPFVVNDDISAALAADADGAHIGQDDMPVHQARHLLGSNKLLGVSAQTVEQALQAEREGADYLGVGAVFPTNSKDNAAEVSTETLQAICNAVQIPVVAIGGITCTNVSSIANTGIAGVAVISAIFAQNDIVTATKQLEQATRMLTG